MKKIATSQLFVVIMLMALPGCQRTPGDVCMDYARSKLPEGASYELQGVDEVKTPDGRLMVHVEYLIYPKDGRTVLLANPIQTCLFETDHGRPILRDGLDHDRLRAEHAARQR